MKRYDPQTLLALVKQGYRIAFLNAAASFSASISHNVYMETWQIQEDQIASWLFPSNPNINVPHENFLSNSGGNALHAALAMCDRVDVFGVGLFSEGADGDKLYAHAYDDRVAAAQLRQED